MMRPMIRIIIKATKASMCMIIFRSRSFCKSARQKMHWQLSATNSLKIFPKCSFIRFSDKHPFDRHRGLMLFSN